MAEIVDQPAIRQAIIDLADDIVVTLDESGRVTSFNAAAERAFGHTADEASSMNVEALFPALSGPLSESVPRGRRGGIKALHRDGTTFAVELRQQRIPKPRETRSYWSFGGCRISSSACVKATNVSRPSSTTPRPSST